MAAVSCDLDLAHGYKNMSTDPSPLHLDVYSQPVSEAHAGILDTILGFLLTHTARSMIGWYVHGWVSVA